MAIIGNPKYEARIERHLAKYETKRSAVMPLLYNRAGRIWLGQ